MSTSVEQFGRKAKLVLVNDASGGLDLSEFRFKFHVNQFDGESPNSAVIRIYNLGADTVKRIVGDGKNTEFGIVILEAGYDNSNQYGQIFTGSICRFKTGRERNVDSYLEISATDSDLGYNFGDVNATLENDNPNALLNLLAKQMSVTIDPEHLADYTKIFGGLVVLPRGKVMMGLVRSYMRDRGQTNGFRWSLQNGTLVLVPITGYLSGDQVEINSATGMVGIPEATDNGVSVKCLLNPNIAIGRAVLINNKDITTTFSVLQGFPSPSSQADFPAFVALDGKYRVISHDYVGDTRGLEWHSILNCLSIDGSAPVNPTNLTRFNLGAIAPFNNPK